MEKKPSIEFVRLRPTAMEGGGEYLEHRGHLFQSKGSKPISRTRATWVTDEHSFNSRVRGEKDYLIVAWNGEDFTVLEEPGDGELRGAFAKYRGLGHDEAVRVARETFEARVRQREEWENQLPKCPRCGKPWLILDDSPDCGHCEDPD